MQTGDADAAGIDVLSVVWVCLMAVVWCDGSTPVSTPAADVCRPLTAIAGMRREFGFPGVAEVDNATPCGVVNIHRFSVYPAIECWGYGIGNLMPYSIKQGF